MVLEHKCSELDWVGIAEIEFRSKYPERPELCVRVFDDNVFGELEFRTEIKYCPYCGANLEDEMKSLKEGKANE